MYELNDLSAEPIFAGGFINFGYWKGVPLEAPLTVEQRVASQQEMYRLALLALAVTGSDRVVEIGCGVGRGAAWVMDEFSPAEVRGIDLHPMQVERAESINAEALAAHRGRLSYQQGPSNAIPFPDGAFDKAYSVEAAQHFDDLPGFAAEVFRVLSPGGRLAIATFFPKAGANAAELAELLPPFDNGIDRAVHIGTVAQYLQQAGLDEVLVTSIGEHVWAGWDQWLRLTAPEWFTWSRSWLVAYRKGLLDYYLVTACKPG